MKKGCNENNNLTLQPVDHTKKSFRHRSFASRTFARFAKVFAAPRKSNYRISSIDIIFNLIAPAVLSGVKRLIGFIDQQVDV